MADLDCFRRDSGLVWIVAGHFGERWIAQRRSIVVMTSQSLEQWSGPPRLNSGKKASVQCAQTCCTRRPRRAGELVGDWGGGVLGDMGGGVGGDVRFGDGEFWMHWASMDILFGFGRFKVFGWITSVFLCCAPADLVSNVLLVTDF